MNVSSPVLASVGTFNVPSQASRLALLLLWLRGVGPLSAPSSVLLEGLFVIRVLSSNLDRFCERHDLLSTKGLDQVTYFDPCLNASMPLLSSSFGILLLFVLKRER